MFLIPSMPNPVSDVQHQPSCGISLKTLWMANFLDHFDLALYMSLAPLFGQIFSTELSTSLEKSVWFHSVTFATSALSYPLGTYVFGYIAQKKSPLLGLRWSIWGFSLSTLAMGMTPTPTLSMYPLLGPWLFCAFRFLQCLFARGERAISTLYLMAHATEKSALDRAVVYDIIVMAGHWCAQIVAFGLLQSGYTFLWRWPFLIAGFLGCGTAWARCKTMLPTNQSEDFMPNISPNTPPQPLNAYDVDTALCLSPRSLPHCSSRPRWQWFAALACMTGPSYIFYALTFYLMTDFVPMITSLSVAALAGQKIYLTAIDILTLLLVHKILRRYTGSSGQSRRSLLPIMRTICWIGMLLFPAAFWGINFWPSLIYVGCVRVFWIVMGVTYALCFFATLRQAMCSTQKPYVFVSTAQILGTILLGHSASVVSLWLYGKTHWSCAPGLYGAFVCALGVWGLNQFQKIVLNPTLFRP